MNNYPTCTNCMVNRGFHRVVSHVPIVDFWLQKVNSRVLSDNMQKKIQGQLKKKFVCPDANH